MKEIDYTKSKVGEYGIKICPKCGRPGAFVKYKSGGFRCLHKSKIINFVENMTDYCIDFGEKG